MLASFVLSNSLVLQILSRFTPSGWLLLKIGKGVGTMSLDAVWMQHPE
jgi:hypothetical protein